MIVCSRNWKSSSLQPELSLFHFSRFSDILKKTRSVTLATESALSAISVTDLKVGLALSFTSPLGVYFVMFTLTHACHLKDFNLFSSSVLFV